MSVQFGLGDGVSYQVALTLNVSDVFAAAGTGVHYLAVAADLAADSLYGIRKFGR